MLTLIKGIKAYAPEYLGEKDVLLAGGKIAAVENSIRLDTNLNVKIVDGEGRLLSPGLIDGHVHIQGGGGEGGFKTRTPEVMLSDIVKGGVTTVVGCLGTDGTARDLVSLLAKARGLEEEGVTTYIYTGSYHLPLVTITGDVMKDIITIDKVIGAGEIAISDHRSSQPTIDELKRLAADVRVSGMLAGKGGVINVHLGDGKAMIDYLFRIAEETEIPITQFLPTHMGRNPRLFEEAIRYAKAGGYVDFTTSSDPMYWEDGEVRASAALKRCLDAGVDDSRITYSSDGGGSLPSFDEHGKIIGLKVGSVASVFEEIRDAVVNQGVAVHQALKVATRNPAVILGLKGKGIIAPGMDADVLVVNEKDFTVDTVIAKGEVMVEGGEIRAWGTFEKV